MGDPRVSTTIPAAALTRSAARRVVMPLTRWLLLSDIFVVAAVMTGAHAVRFGWDPSAPVEGPTGPPYLWLSAAIAALWVFQLGWTRSRDPLVLGEGSEEFQRVGTASWLTFVVVVLFGFFTGLDISRVYLFLALPVGTLVILGYRAAWRGWLKERRRHGAWRSPVIVAGPGAAVAEARPAHEVLRRRTLRRGRGMRPLARRGGPARARPR
ncbi:hypothetical protein GCM10025876_14140 [Demequina litorisediminis]|uniref:Sugar transferase n=1 Tax=Demequina litorisediminis TaxID=1849022 RepID=A0ABQ6IBV6_9MICO|nr:hypothetical protein GCM10025876_14140 [Demequina litorisediminis]